MVRVATLLLVILPFASAPIAAQQHGGFSGLSPADRQAIAGEKLTMANIDKSVVAAGKLHELEKDPKLKALMQEQDKPKSFDEVIAKMDATPPVRSAIESSGLTTREFLLTVLAVNTTRSAAKLQAMGGQAAKMAANIPTSPQNLQFYAAHQAEIEKAAMAMRADSTE